MALKSKAISKNNIVKKSFLVLLILTLSACVEKQVFKEKGFDPNSIKSIAVLPFQNLSNHATAHKIAKESFEIELRTANSWQVNSLSTSSLYKLGLDSSKYNPFEELEVNELVGSSNWNAESQSSTHLVVGKVQEYKYKRGLGEKPVVGLSASLYELDLSNSVQKYKLLASVQLSLQPGVELWDQGALSQLCMKASKQIVSELVSGQE